MKIFLDDIRDPKTNDWIIVRTAKDCINLIKSNKNEFYEISFDHDLGDEEYTGYNVAKWIEAECFFGMKCPKWNIHSANPVGRQNIEAAMKSAENFSRRNK